MLAKEEIAGGEPMLKVIFLPLPGAVTASLSPAFCCFAAMC